MTGCQRASARVTLGFLATAVSTVVVFFLGGVGDLVSLAGVQRHWQGPGDSLFFQGIGGSGFFFDQRTEAFCRCDVGFFEFQISFEICRHRLAVPVFNRE